MAVYHLERFVACLEAQPICLAKILKHMLDSLVHLEVFLKHAERFGLLGYLLISYISTFLGVKVTKVSVRGTLRSYLKLKHILKLGRPIYLLKSISN